LLLAVFGVTTSPVLPLVGSAIAGWCLILALLGMAAEHLTRTTPTLEFLSESAFPVYVLHQIAIVVPGYLIVQLPLGVGMKFLLLLGTAVALTMGTYQWLVRPFNVPRVLLGMKPRACPMRRPVPTAHAATTLLLVALCAQPGVALARMPTGLWYAEGGAAQVAIEPCGDGLCGRVASLRSPFDEDGCDLRDKYNPDPTLRDRRVEGLTILWGLRPTSDETWDGGQIYDPSSGATYRCTAGFLDPDRLWLRGYLGIRLLGRTTTWVRVGSENRTCHGGGR
jgi:uncharacterized protein (DUF2147 family)